MIRKAKLNDLNEIAKIHKESFENHFLPKLGLSLLARYYSNELKGKGVSKLLVEEFEKKLVEHGYDGYTLTVHKANDRANYFYKRMNMYICSDSESSYKYKKSLNS